MNGRAHTLRGSKIATLPNALSFLRILLLAPTLVALERQPAQGSLPVILVLGCALGTDALDGVLARWRGWVSEWGRALDPLADKVYLGGVVLYLALVRDFPAWLLGLVLVRDVFLIVTSALLARRYNVVFGANLWGKASTLALSVLVFAYVLRVDAPKPWLTAAVVAALVVSLLGYLRNAASFLRSGAARPA